MSPVAKLIAQPTPAAIGLGSNVDPRESYLSRGAMAIARLDHSQAIRFSRVFENAAIDCPEPYPFLNAAILIHTHLDAEELLMRLQAIEAECNRRRPYQNAPRTLDLDLLLFGETVLDKPNLVLPHPRLHQRLFALEPLLEIWPDAQHPGLGRSIRALSKSCRQRHPQQQLHCLSGIDLRQ